MKYYGEKYLDKREKKTAGKEIGRKEKQYQMVEDENSVYEYDINCINETKEKL